MGSEDNSVNIKSDKDRYHHGDLRSALVAEGLRLLAEGDAELVSLRHIARNVGVSATAVYRHFPDKHSLLAALAREGAEMLARQQMAAQAEAGDGIAGFDATGRAYVHFALENPALFRLMMASARREAMLDDKASETTGLGLLRRNIARLAAPGTTQAEQRARIVKSWAMVHGLAMLMLDGYVPADPALIDDVVDTRAFHDRD